MSPVPDRPSPARSRAASGAAATGPPVSDGRVDGGPRHEPRPDRRRGRHPRASTWCSSTSPRAGTGSVAAPRSCCARCTTATRAGRRPSPTSIGGRPATSTTTTGTSGGRRPCRSTATSTRGSSRRRRSRRCGRMRSVCGSSTSKILATALRRAAGPEPGGAPGGAARASPRASRDRPSWPRPPRRASGGWRAALADPPAAAAGPALDDALGLLGAALRQVYRTWISREDPVTWYREVTSASSDRPRARAHRADLARPAARPPA